MVIDNQPRDETVLSTDLQERMLTHAGKWVAMTRTDLLAVGDTPDEVLHEAAEKGEKRPILYFVPPKGDTSMFF
jgi:hypothetical protein